METEQIAREVFDGVMLSDGGLVRQSESRNAYFDMALSCHDGRVPILGLLEYLQYVKRECFDVLGVEVRVGHPKIRRRIRTSGLHLGETYEYASLATKSSLFLTLQHNRWYPNRSRYKEVPTDLVLTPVLSAHWFMGDGTSCRVLLFPTVYCELSTQGLNIYSIEALEDQLHQLGISTGRKVARADKGSGIKITVLQVSLNDFMNLVDPYVIEPYRYKVKYRRVG